MEEGSQAGVLQKLLDRLCQESDPREIYKLLKEMYSVPIMHQSLAETGFLRTIKRLKKQQLLAQFVKDLVGKWSTGFPMGLQPEQEPQDFGLEVSLTAERQSTSPKQKPPEHGSQKGQGAGREVCLGHRIRDPDTISLLSLSRKSDTRSDPRARYSRSLDPGETRTPEQQLARQNLVHIGGHGASREEPGQDGGATTLSRKPRDTSDKHDLPAFGGHRKSQPPGQCEQDAAAPGSGSFGAGLRDDCCAPSSQVLPSLKRKSKVPWLAEVQKPLAKIPRGESRSSKGLSRTAACDIPASPSRDQACFAMDVVQEPSSSELDPEDTSCGWAYRKNHRTPVYSGCRPAARIQQKSQRLLLPEEPTGIREANRSQAGKEEAEPGHSEGNTPPESQAYKQTHRKPGSSAPLCLQESEEEKLQRLRTRIQNTRAKRQARQTIMVAFPIQVKSPGHQGEPGPRGAVSAQNVRSLSDAPAHPGAQKASCLPSGERGRKRDPAKRPAPLMAKSLKDYRHRFSGK